MKYTREQIQQTVEDMGYKYFHDNLNKGYDVNIIGVRNSKTKGKRLIDIGTGSGIIPIILQKELPNLEYFGIEISLSAIKVAKRNIYLHKSKINLLNESIKETNDMSR